MFALLILADLLSGALVASALLYLNFHVGPVVRLSFHKNKERRVLLERREMLERARVSNDSRVAISLRIYVVARTVFILFFAITIIAVLHENLA
jgi:hypothetical protein